MDGFELAEVDSDGKDLVGVELGRATDGETGVCEREG